MARDDETTTTPVPKPCKSAADQLKDVKAEIDAFESRKLGDLKSALEKFVPTQAEKAATYNQKYVGLKDRWRQQQREIETLYASIKNCFPDPVPTRIKDCICTFDAVIADLKRRIDARKRECKPCEVQRDAAKDAFDKADDQLNALLNLVTKLEAILDANGGKESENGKGGLIKSIREYLAKPEQRTVAFYQFWFKLIPAHQNIRPDDAGDPKPLALRDFCKTYGDAAAESGDKGPDTSTDAADPYASCRKLTMTLPRLVKPETYSGLLDCAFLCFNDSKKELARLESELKRKYDELDGWIKQRTDRQNTLDADITNCLKALPPGEPCCPETDSSRTGA